MIYRAADLSNEFISLCKEGKKRTGVSTGYPSLDPFLSLSKGYMSIVSGIPSMGKSEFVDALALNTAVQHGWRWCFFSPENYPLEEHIAKLAEKYIGKRIDHFTVSDRNDALDFIDTHFIWLYPEEDKLWLENLLQLVEQVHQTEGALDAFCFDPWNEIIHNNSGLRDDQYLAGALRIVRKFARKNDLHAVIVAHPNRTEKDDKGQFKPPSLYDLNGGAMWRNKADYGYVIHRHNMSLNEITLYIQKIKYKWMGQIGAVEFDYDISSGRFKCKDNPRYTLPERFDPVPF